MKLTDEYKARGFIAQKQKGYYVTRIRTRAGNMTSKQIVRVAQLADKYGQGYVHFTTRQAVEIPGVQETDYEAIMQEIREADLLPAVCGPRVRTIVACPGLAYCKFGLLDTVSLAENLDELFVGLELPAKTKIAISGCPNSCAKPQENDIGLQGSATVEVQDGCIGCNACVKTCRVKAITVAQNRPLIDKHECINCGRCAAICPAKAVTVKHVGYNLYIGGKIGRQPRLGTKIITAIPQTHVVLHVEAVINVYKQLANKGERIANMLERIDLEYLQTEINKEVTRLKNAIE